MTLRKIILGGLAALIVIVALIVAMVNITTKPTFSVSAIVKSHNVTFPVECHAIGPGQLEKLARFDGSVDLDSNSQIYEGMSAEDFKTYVSLYGALQTIPPAPQAVEAYRTTVQDKITYRCSQLRENQQAGLMMTFGLSLLLLLSVGIAAILTEPRRDPTPKVKVEHGHNA